MSTSPNIWPALLMPHPLWVQTFCTSLSSLADSLSSSVVKKSQIIHIDNYNISNKVMRWKPKALSWSSVSIGGNNFFQHWSIQKSGFLLLFPLPDVQVHDRGLGRSFPLIKYLPLTRGLWNIFALNIRSIWQNFG